MGSAAFAYAPAEHVATRHPAYPAANANDRVARPRKRRNELSLRSRIAIVMIGGLLGWAVPIACAATLL